MRNLTAVGFFSSLGSLLLSSLQVLEQHLQILSLLIGIILGILGIIGWIWRHQSYFQKPTKHNEQSE